MDTKLTFKFERETKRTNRFLEEANDPVVGKVYVRQSAFDHRQNSL